MVGNDVFKTMYEKYLKIGSTFRIADPSDAVTKSPPEFFRWLCCCSNDSYVHVHGKNYSACEKIYEANKVKTLPDLICSCTLFRKGLGSHALDSYKSFVAKHFKQNKAPPKEETSLNVSNIN